MALGAASRVALREPTNKDQRGRQRRAPLRAARPPPPRTKWTRRIPHPVLIGHVSSASMGRGPVPLRAARPGPREQVRKLRVPRAPAWKALRRAGSHSVLFLRRRRRRRFCLRYVPAVRSRGAARRGRGQGPAALRPCCALRLGARERAPLPPLLGRRGRGWRGHLSGTCIRRSTTAIRMPWRRERTSGPSRKR